MIPLREDGWPLVHETADPWAGDEWLDEAPTGWDNYESLRTRPSTGRAAFDALDARFLDLYREILRGGRPWGDPALAELARDLELPAQRTHDSRGPLSSPAIIGDPLLCDAVENYIPDIAAISCDRILGPWADLAPPPALIRAAVAAMATSIQLREGVRLPIRWSRDRPRPSPSLRRAVRAVFQAPAVLWSVEGEDWRPLIPLDPAFVPPPGALIQPNRLPTIGATWRRPPIAAIARIYPAPDGWRPVACVGLPDVIPQDLLLRRLDLELLRLRRWERRATWEDLLRWRPEVLYRTCARWCWALEEGEVDPDPPTAAPP